MRSWKGGLALASLAIAVMTALATPAVAAPEVYPTGGSGFNGSAEGWETTGASCDVPLLCAADGGYDGEHGSPAGSLTADTNIALNLVSIFHFRGDRRGLGLDR